MTQTTESNGLLFNFVKWYGYIFAGTFVLYGGVKIILGVLDRQYDDLSTWVISLLEGIIIAVICVAFRDRQRWGWYGLLAVNGLVVLLALINLGDALNIVILVFSAAALAALLAPPTKQLIFGSR